jgi:hypothetical protein
LNLPVCDGHVKAILSVGCVKKKIKNVTLLAGHINKGTATMQLGTTKMKKTCILKKYLPKSIFKIKFFNFSQGFTKV